MLWGVLPALGNKIQIEVISMTKTTKLSVSKDQLLGNPHIQAAAIAHLAASLTFTPEEEDADDYSRQTRVLDDCYDVMGITENSVWADHVSDAIRTLSTTMKSSLVKAGVLRADCAGAWLAQRASVLVGA
jgi:hypothetical protein